MTKDTVTTVNKRGLWVLTFLAGIGCYQIADWII